jgi:hypothetical protein
MSGGIWEAVVGDGVWATADAAVRPATARTSHVHVKRRKRAPFMDVPPWDD